MPPELLARLPDWRALVISVNRSPVVIRFRPSRRRIENRLGLAPAIPGHIPAIGSATITDLASRRAAPASAYDEQDHDESA